MKGIDLSSRDQDIICRDRYKSLERECYDKGLSLVEIEKSMRALGEYTKGKYYLRESDFKPTGVALGCPLPDKRFTSQLWEICQTVNEHIISLQKNEKKTFAFVPPDSYHITLNNRWHFKTSTHATTYLTDKEKIDAQSEVDRLGGGPVVVKFMGLILTPWGRLIVPGFPEGDSLYKIRAALAGSNPNLRENLPNIAHIKLGHVIIKLKKHEQKSLLHNVVDSGNGINCKLIFNQAYTPVGNIIL